MATRAQEIIRFAVKNIVTKNQLEICLMYNEKYRPQFHFTSASGWLNDPNGLIFHDGIYHMFFQHTPDPALPAWTENTGCWGHAVSRDLVHWDELPIALRPDENGSCWSGSVVFDSCNVSGLGEDGKGPLLAFYTGCVRGQCLAYSTDGGTVWEKYPGNPIIPLSKDIDPKIGPDRDPRVIWHEPSGKWVMALFVSQAARLAEKSAGFYTSDDLIHWEYASEIPNYCECPDIFPFELDGSTIWAIVDGTGCYQLGDFDGMEFHAVTELIPGHVGRNYYATQTWGDIPAEDGRRIQIAWMPMIEIGFPGMPFNQQMAFPCNLTLRETSNGPRIFRAPVEEMSMLYADTCNFEKQTIQAGEVFAAEGFSDALDLTVEFELGESPDAEFGLRTRLGEIRYRVADGRLQALDAFTAVPCEDGILRLRILLDRTSLEIYVADGLTFMPFCQIPDLDAPAMELFAENAPVMVKKLTVHNIKSIWPDDA